MRALHGERKAQKWEAQLAPRGGSASPCIAAQCPIVTGIQASVTVTGPRGAAGAKGVRHWRVYTATDRRCVHCVICMSDICAMVQKSWRKIEREGWGDRVVQRGEVNRGWERREKEIPRGRAGERKVPLLPVGTCLVIQGPLPLFNPPPPPSCPGTALRGPCDPHVISGHTFTVDWSRVGVTSTNLIPISGLAGSAMEETQVTLIPLSSGTDGREMWW